MTVIRVTSLTEERFREIVDAYGADPARWPEAERAAAAIFARNHPDISEPVLEAARQLDAWLDADLIDVPEDDVLDAHARAVAAFVDAHVDTADVLPVPMRRPRPMPLVWATGVALAACIAGAVLGINVSMQSIGDLRAQSVLDQAQLSDGEN
ncbi:hypothetical protein [Asticcacaulis solisilvae]|uniref:hypothetical protein n=1 Tax=Asticcacaulis solisilvae TaxID=1217274 RepID=UPI003FD8F707